MANSTKTTLLIYTQLNSDRHLIEHPYCTRTEHQN
uniref:Uncharacterized protein n=1 Tax=Arundo donax TaxID=35708 RepID=A0A0A8XYI2_ARUDO